MKNAVKLWLVLGVSLVGACGKGDDTGGSGDGDGDGDASGGSISTGDSDGDGTGGNSLPDLCENGEHDPGEADVDCAGMCEKKCGTGSMCADASNCESSVCAPNGSSGGAGGGGGEGGASGEEFCQDPSCGDGVVHSGEECDEGEATALDCDYDDTSCMVCNFDCEMVPGAVHVCGDDVTDEEETCDGLGCTDDCQEYLIDCEDVLDADPGAENGAFVVDLDGDGEGAPVEVYCDMDDGGVTYLELAMGRYNEFYPGYELINFTLMQTTAIQEFFIWAYNSQEGLINIHEGFAGGNCCFAYSGNEWVNFGGGPDDYLVPGDENGDVCPNDDEGYPNDRYYIFRETIESSEFPPLPEDYFTTNPVSSTDTCSSSSNPGFLMKRLIPVE